MRPLRYIGVHMLVIVLVTICSPVYSQVSGKKWSGTLRDWSVIYNDDLKQILADHKKWVDCRHKTMGWKNITLECEAIRGKRADLRGAHLYAAMLRGANLEGAELNFVQLENARMSGIILKDALLNRAFLKNADLTGANLEGADLSAANLESAHMEGVDFKNTNFELTPKSLPDIPSISLAKNISLLRYNKFPHALIELRKAFKESGYRRQEREITYAIKHSGFQNVMEDKKANLMTKTEVTLGWVFFEMTCKWGMSPERPLFILFGLIFFFMIPYSVIIRRTYGRSRNNGIWKVWIKGRMRTDLGSNKQQLLRRKGFAAWSNGFYFSVLSAFNIGWKELNVGNWISRIQPYEYRLQASGMARTISGIQSIISVYLLALSVLTYFGRPFEGM